MSQLCPVARCFNYSSIRSKASFFPFSELIFHSVCSRCMAPLLLTSPKSLVSGFAIKPDALCMRLRLGRRVQWRPRQLASLAASSGGVDGKLICWKLTSRCRLAVQEQMRWWDRSVQVHHEPCLINTDRMTVVTVSVLVRCRTFSSKDLFLTCNMTLFYDNSFNLELLMLSWENLTMMPPVITKSYLRSAAL